MAIQGITVGKDIVVQFANTNGSVTVNRVKMHTTSQKVSSRSSIALDGVTRHANLPVGWTGSIEMERTSPDVDAFFANLEAQYLAGQSIPPITITETITENDGSVSQFQYLGCVIEFNNSGDWKGDDFVSQKINFNAQARNQLA